MIAFDDVLTTLSAQLQPLGQTTCHPTQAYGRILAQKIARPMALPPFAQSAMDGYAICLHPTDTHYTLTGQLVAGQSNEGHHIGPSQAYRITTGAMLPHGADAVVRKEYAIERDAQTIDVTQTITQGQDIRPVGEWLGAAHVIGTKGQPITPSMAAMAAMLGVDQIEVYKKPRVGLVSCGDEIIAPGRARAPWQVYDGNTTLMMTLLKQRGVSSITHIHLPDTMDVVEPRMAELAEQVDVLITTGGASVGARDILGQLSQRHERLFYKIAQRPGKPTFLTRFHRTLWLGLPGPPLAAYLGGVTHMSDLLDLLEGATPQPWRPTTTDAHHPKMTLLQLARRRHDACHILSNSPYEAMLEADCVVRVDPITKQASWRWIHPR